MIAINEISKYSHQVVVTSSEHPDNIISVGNGFFFRYRGKIFFITAAHVLKDEVNRGGKVFLLTHYRKSPLSTCVIQVQNFYDLNFIDLTHLGGFSFDFDHHQVDCAFCDMSNWNLTELPILFGDDTTPKTDHMSLKCLSDMDVASASIDKKYLLWGRISQHLCGLQWQSSPYMYQNIVYDNPGLWGLESFLIEGDTDMSCWSGLSGSPFFDENGGLIGMVQEKDDSSPLLNVLSISCIMDSIDTLYFEK